MKQNWIVAGILIAFVMAVAFMASCNKSTTVEPIPEHNGIDTVVVDRTQNYGDYTFPDTTYWEGHGEVVVDKNAAHHPCCLDAWGCVQDPGVPFMTPFYAAHNVTETIYRVISGNKPQEDFTGVEVAVLDGSGVYVQGSCGTIFFDGGMLSHSASCHINPPFTCP